MVCKTLSAGGQVRRILFQNGGQDHSPNNQTLASCRGDVMGNSAVTFADPVFKKTAGVVNRWFCLLPLPARSENARRPLCREINAVGELRHKRKREDEQWRGFGVDFFNRTTGLRAGRTLSKRAAYCVAAIQPAMAWALRSL